VERPGWVDTVILDGAGHYIGEDAAREIVAALTEWASQRG
jgi:hypothetical protein